MPRGIKDKNIQSVVILMKEGLAGINIISSSDPNQFSPRQAIVDLGALDVIMRNWMVMMRRFLSVLLGMYSTFHCAV